MCRALAVRHGPDPLALYQAGLYHDLAREMGRDDLLAEARRLQWDMDASEAAEPLLLHGPVAGLWARQEGLSEEVVLAIFWHTTAHPDLSRAGQILFIADGVEPGRGDYPGRVTLHDQAFSDLTGAYRDTLFSTRRYLESRKLIPHPRMLAALERFDGGAPPQDGRMR